MKDSLVGYVAYVTEITNAYKFWSLNMKATRTTWVKNFKEIGCKGVDRVQRQALANMITNIQTAQKPENLFSC
jgi:hypothetical protein